MSRSWRGAEQVVGRLLRDGVDSPGGDARLLHRFLVDRDPTAFEAIVNRHGPPVLAVCRRYLRDPADVEDAFQATFLVLVRKASGLRDADALSSWLYGVAYRVAVRARSDALKRRGREGDREGLRDAPADPSRPADDALEVLDEELSRLPEKYRAPLMLCYLKGRTHDQAAADLGWPVGTVRSRMAKGRSLLRDRLSRRGVDAPACLSALRAEVVAIPSVPSSLVAATASAAVRFAGLSAGLAWLGASPSSSTWPAARLALGVLATMSTTPWKVLGIAFACAGITVGALAAGSIEAPGGPQDPPKPEPKAAAEKPAPKDVEGRLSEVERKLDRMMELVESLPARIETSISAAAPAKLDETPGLSSSAPPTIEARTLREIEAQLVNVERRYRIVDALVRAARAPQIDREDAIAPARVLVARLREMEDEGRAQLTRTEREYALPPGTLDDPAKALPVVEERIKKSEERAKEAQEAWQKLSSDLNTPEVQKAAKELSKARMESQKVASFLGLHRLPPSGNSPLEKHGPSMLDTLKPTYSKLAEVRRLIAWAKERFPDVELTAEDAPAPEGEPAD